MTTSITMDTSEARPGAVIIGGSFRRPGPANWVGIRSTWRGSGERPAGIGRSHRHAPEMRFFDRVCSLGSAVI